MTNPTPVFKENDTVYFISGKYPNQSIDCGTIEFFFDCNVSNDTGNHPEKFACVKTESNKTKGGMQLSLLFPTPEAARARIHAELTALRRKYHRLIHSYASPLENAMRFAMKHPVCEHGGDPIARQVFMEYAHEHGLMYGESSSNTHGNRNR